MLRAPVVTRPTNFVVDEPCDHVSILHVRSETDGEPAVVRDEGGEDEFLGTPVIAGVKAEAAPAL